MYFSQWKSLLPLREKESFNCEVCLKRKLDEGRVCFMYNDTVKLTLPSVLEWNEEREMPVVSNYIEEEVAADQLLDGIFLDLCKFVPDKPAFEVLLDFNKVLNNPNQICPTGLVSTDFINILDMYQMCEQYSVLPEPGGYLDQSMLLMEIFKILKQEEIRFEKIRMENDSKKKGA